MDQSDTVRKQFIFSNISSFFSFFAPERKPQGSSENRMVLTGWQYSLPSCLWSRHCHRATRCFRCSLGCLGICLFWEWGRSEPSSPVIAGGWIVDDCLPSLPCKPLYPWQLILQTRRVTSEVSLKKKKSYSHGISHILLIPSYQLSQVFIWQVLCCLAGGGGHSCLEHTLWDSCWQNL